MLKSHYESYLRRGGEPFAADEAPFVDPPTFATMRECGGSVSPVSKSGEGSTGEEESPPLGPSPSSTAAAVDRMEKTLDDIATRLEDYPPRVGGGSRSSTPPSDRTATTTTAAPINNTNVKLEHHHGAHAPGSQLRVKCDSFDNFDVFGMTDYLDSPDSVLPGHSLHSHQPSAGFAAMADFHRNQSSSAAAAATHFGSPYPTADINSDNNSGSGPTSANRPRDVITNFFEGVQPIHGFRHQHQQHFGDPHFGDPRQVTRNLTMPLQASPYSSHSSLSNVMMSQVIGTPQPPSTMRSEAQRSLYFGQPLSPQQMPQHHHPAPWGPLNSGTALNRAQTSALEMIDQASRCASRSLAVVQSEMLLAPTTTATAANASRKTKGGSSQSPRKRKSPGKATGSAKGDSSRKKSKQGSSKASSSKASAAAAAEKREKQRTSQYRGVSRHRLTRRWEASCWVQRKQLYLGGFDEEEKAARAYDVAALVCKGLDAQINFHLKDYMQHLEVLRHCSQEELVAHIRRQSSAFSRGKSKYRGVSGHELRWEARIGQYEGKKNVSFGIYENEVEAARQYDRALVIARGRSAKTNFALSFYCKEIKTYETFIASLPPAEQQKARQSTTLPLSPEQGGADAGGASAAGAASPSKQPSSPPPQPSSPANASNSSTGEEGGEGKSKQPPSTPPTQAKKKKAAAHKNAGGSGPALIYAEQLKRALGM
uniref:AP2/ERF domain-containing protein n=1 Tax=Chloropicon laureae TaxID=464258 RepID=A0A7S2Z109_9CHLO|mmetsp:Transcript_13648/g.35222  ORF Transcript_13648/g.35222 Transcript_13648/m.35222 type:complete len:709 (+) Transcript_13648:236-2362(+)